MIKPKSAYQLRKSGKTHNTYDATIPKQPPRISDALRRLFDMGNEHEKTVYALWSAADPDVVDLSSLNNEPGHAQATVREMREGRAVILGGCLPDDPVGGRTGKPDVLLRDKGGAGYHPCDVKAHTVIAATGRDGVVSTIRTPALADAVVQPNGVRHRPEDLLQLAHYWRMLQACGLQAKQPWGAIVGTGDLDVPVLAWYDLNLPRYTTYSASARGNKTKRSTLERYDHEHNFRVKVARVAQQRAGSSDDPDLTPRASDKSPPRRWW